MVLELYKHKDHRRKDGKSWRTVGWGEGTQGGFEVPPDLITVPLLLRPKASGKGLCSRLGHCVDHSHFGDSNRQLTVLYQKGK